MRHVSRMTLAAAAAIAALTTATAAAGTSSPSGPLRVVMMRPPLAPTTVTPPGVTLPVYVQPPLGGTPFPGNMAYYGGEVVHHAQIYVDLWGWPRRLSARERGYVQTLLSFLRGVGGSSWLGVTTQFYAVSSDGAASFITNRRHLLHGVWADAVPPVRDRYDDGLLAGEARRAAARFGVLGNHDAVVIVASPPGENPAGFYADGYCAWHSWSDGVAFINLPYLLASPSGCGAYWVNLDPAGVYDGVSIVVGHELAEALTDPGAGFEGPGAGWHDIDWQETADKCEWIPPGRPGGALDIALPTGRFAVQQLWSNAALAGVGNCAAGS